VGKIETLVRVPYLQNDKQQDGGSTNVCLSILLLVIINGWIGEWNWVHCKMLRTICKVIILNYLNMTLW